MRDRDFKVGQRVFHTMKGKYGFVVELKGSGTVRIRFDERCGNGDGDGHMWNASTEYLKIMSSDKEEIE